ncbi:hypothetical protein [Paenibacillus agri]|uniref:YgiT-type zinc finger protein n=1 Tax=Paenibacillus agri TaxID=2744309 RepID=A0A850EXC5_9BACL|nr:hypothetical protein [Paenibacillus agri]NUU64184.1 hypothetical protein [Paenibacillus agri]
MWKDDLLEKACSCGGDMTIHMHTLVYNTKIKITDVPVYNCEDCSRYEPLPAIKPALGELVQQLGREGTAGSKISLADGSEWAFVLKETFSKFSGEGLPELEAEIRKAVQSRIDLLLDIYRFAADSEDVEWMRETGDRLSQLTLRSTQIAK